VLFCLKVRDLISVLDRAVDLARVPAEPVMSKKKHGGSGRRGSQREASPPQTEFLFRCTLSNTIYDVCYNRPGWTETHSESDWDFNFTDVKWVHDFLGNHHMVRQQAGAHTLQIAHFSSPTCLV